MAGCAKGVDGRAHGAQACGGDVLSAGGCVARRVVRLRAPPAPEAAPRSARLRPVRTLKREASRAADTALPPRSPADETRKNSKYWDPYQAAKEGH